MTFFKEFFKNMLLATSFMLVCTIIAAVEGLLLRVTNQKGE